MNEIKVVFSPKLDIDPAEFITLWNDTPECREIAEAQLGQLSRTQFSDKPSDKPSKTTSVIVFIIATITLNIASNRLDEFLKNRLDEFLKNKFPDKVYEDLQCNGITQEDNSKIITVSPKKDNTKSSE